jgi:enolase-phosphatase E1
MICTYSSGSVLAQKLLFGTISTGDLTPYISAFFDTRVGAKTEAQSYRNIAASLSCDPKEFLFVSDVAMEIGAARSAGMQAILCVRDPHVTAAIGAEKAIPDFNGIFAE